MLEITSRQDFDILKIIPVIAKFNVKSSVSRKRIFIEDKLIPAEILREICKIIPHYSARNYSDHEVTPKMEETHTELKSIIQDEASNKKYFPTKKGDVFFCNFGEPFEHEIGLKRPCIVLHNFADRVLVLPCTTNQNVFEGKFEISFSNENFSKIENPLSVSNSMGIPGQLRTVDKSRLIKRIGTLTNDYLKVVTLNIQTYLLLNVSGLSYSQLKLLKIVGMEKMAEILSYKVSNLEKINKILVSYGFNQNSNGFPYLRDAILYSLELDNKISIPTLSQEIAKKSLEKVSSNEVERLISARFKEVFGKDYKPYEFIRLIRTLLKEEEKA